MALPEFAESVFDRSLFDLESFAGIGLSIYLDYFVCNVTFARLEIYLSSITPSNRLETISVLNNDRGSF